MQMLEGVIRNYQWGSVTTLPEFCGRPKDGEPWAELWLGAHRSSPSQLGGSGHTLAEAIESDGAGQLGTHPVERFGELPFMMKVLAVAAPLSLQVHPDQTDAKAGFAREEQAGIAIDAFERSFKDPNHKPEMVCALTDFDALYGFRSVAETLGVLNGLQIESLAPVRALLSDNPNDGGVRAAITFLLGLDLDSARSLVADVVESCRRYGDGPYLDVASMALTLAEHYPNDGGVGIALLMNLVHLKPGQAVFVSPTTLHAYLCGTAVEVLANSDNVVRGGLTPKHVDAQTLLDVASFEPVSVAVQEPAAVNGVATFDSPVEEFCVQRLDIDSEHQGPQEFGDGPAIVLCVDGVADLGELTLDRGDAAWVAANDAACSITGRATLYVASLGEPARS